MDGHRNHISASALFSALSINYKYAINGPCGPSDLRAALWRRPASKNNYRPADSQQHDERHTIQLQQLSYIRHRASATGVKRAVAFRWFTCLCSVFSVRLPVCMFGVVLLSVFCCRYVKTY